jgi:hypothetical protein
MLEFLKLLERIVRLVEMAAESLQGEKLRRKIEEKVSLAKAKRSQIPLEELTGPGGLPSRHKYSGMRVEEKRTGMPSDGSGPVDD